MIGRKEMELLHMLAQPGMYVARVPRAYESICARMYVWCVGAHACSCATFQAHARREVSVLSRVCDYISVFKLNGRHNW